MRLDLFLEALHRQYPPGNGYAIRPVLTWHTAWQSELSLRTEYASTGYSSPRAPDERRIAYIEIGEDGNVASVRPTSETLVDDWTKVQSALSH